MSENLPNNNTSQEIDIIAIFNLIGKAIKSLFYQIFNLLKYLFEGVLLTSLFIKRHLKKLIIAGAVGFAVGTISDYLEESYYTSTMVVEPNFQTSTQLIETMKLYNQLVRSKDSTRLSEILKITESEANSIITIGIRAKINGNTKLKNFNEFIKEADTMTLKRLSFEEYESNLEITDYNQYYIYLNTSDRSIYKKVERSFLNLPLSDYSKNLQKTEIENLEKKENTIIKALAKIDSLRGDYKKIMLTETTVNDSKGNGSGTNFYLAAESKRPTNELKLFDLEMSYNRMLEEINKDKTAKSSIINVVSGFQDIGIKVKDKNLKWFVIVALVLSVLFILLINFNKYLNDFESKRKM